MCGIAGLFDAKGRRPFDPGVVAQMTDAIAHRGPDGAGVHVEPGVGLGHRRLAIIDLAGGQQPMQTPDGALTVTFNGEIYNFMELRRELEAKGARFTTRSDTEVLLHGWRLWGPGLFSRLQGMFAFALWDSREETLVLARDRFGKKPLHYAQLADGVLVFGSEIKALLRIRDVDRTLSPEAIEDFFAYGYIPDPRSIYRAIRKLEPATYLLARRGSELRTHRYWSPLERLDAPVDPTEEQLVERLEAAVKRRMISDVPLGALLSGGLDSSAVVALMAGQTDSKVRTFSIGFNERDFDESGYARQVAERYDTEHDVGFVDADDFSLIDRLADIYDEPFGDVSALPTFTVCARARRAVTVALAGDGGDEVLGGYRRYAFHHMGERIRRRVGQPLRERVLAPLADIYPQAAWLPRPLRAKTTLRELSLDSAGAYARIVSALPEERRASLFTEAFRRSLGGYDPSQTVRSHFDVEAPLDPLQRAQYADLMTYLPGDILTKVDRASMANSLEVRAPMLDPEFATWSFRLPENLKLSAKGGKTILKRAMQPYLPHELIYRPKQGFTVPVARWFRGPLRRQVLSLPDSPALADGVIDTSAVRDMAAAHGAGLQDHSKALWLVWVFNAFLGHQREPGVQIR